jgi:nanoRNase/pAp phosphatase (c-di-AMP/oligoRNAs hydrolase)
MLGMEEGKDMATQANGAQNGMDTLSKFFEEVKKLGKTEINIIMHDTPDPDAAGSAFGFQLICKHLGFESKIYYKGEISHPQNKTLVNLLSLPVVKVTNNPPEGVNVCVDGTPQNSCVSEAMLIIDHHKPNNSKAKFQVIKPSLGACSTLVWHMIKEFKIEKNPDQANIYTALLVGIRTDTNDLISDYMTFEDFQAYEELTELADKDLLQKIMNYPLPRYLYDARLILNDKGNSYESNGTFVGGIGFIQATQRDAIAILAQEYARMEGVHTAIIFAVTDKKMLEVSVRSSNVAFDVNAFCKEVFGEHGGGTSYKGAARIPLMFYSNIDDKLKDSFWQVTCNHMFKLVHKENWKDDEKPEN